MINKSFMILKEKDYNSLLENESQYLPEPSKMRVIHDPNENLIILEYTGNPAVYMKQLNEAVSLLLPTQYSKLDFVLGDNEIVYGAQVCTYLPYFSSLRAELVIVDRYTKHIIRGLPDFVFFYDNTNKSKIGIALKPQDYEKIFSGDAPKEVQALKSAAYINTLIDQDIIIMRWHGIWNWLDVGGAIIEDMLPEGKSALFRLDFGRQIKIHQKWPKEGEFCDMFYCEPILWSVSAE